MRSVQCRPVWASGEGTSRSHIRVRAATLPAVRESRARVSGGFPLGIGRHSADCAEGASALPLARFPSIADSLARCRDAI